LVHGVIEKPILGLGWSSLLRPVLRVLLFGLLAFCTLGLVGFISVTIGFLIRINAAAVASTIVEKPVRIKLAYNIGDMESR
jgi:hypothetical protein